MNRAALRAHIINTSFYQPRERVTWFKALMIAIASGVLVLLSMLSQ